jgi:DNA-binding PadR family transcriptional regulator
MPPRVSDFLPLAPRDFLILLALAEGPQHGYGLIRAVEAATDGTVAMDPANLYRALKRMRRDGLVAETNAPDAERRRDYALTTLGRRVLVAEAQRVDALASAARARHVLPRGSGR